MDKRELYQIIKKDLYRYGGKSNIKTFIKFYFTNAGFKYIFLIRMCKYYKTKIKIIYWYYKLLLKHYSYKYNMQIPVNTCIGAGLKIVHFGGIVINDEAVIGKNVNISHQVTIGKKLRGIKSGCPIIGDNVYIAPGAKIIGKIKIGNNVAIGANSVVTKDIPDDAVVVGIPARVISYQGAKEYVNNVLGNFD